MTSLVYVSTVLKVSDDISFLLILYKSQIDLVVMKREERSIKQSAVDEFLWKYGEMSQENRDLFLALHMSRSTQVGEVNDHACHEVMLLILACQHAEECRKWYTDYRDARADELMAFRSKRKERLS